MPREVESLQKNKATEFEYRKLFSLEEEERPHALEQSKEGAKEHISLQRNLFLELPEVIPAKELETPRQSEPVQKVQKKYLQELVF